MKHFSKGATHIHTTHSDGTGSIRQIAKDAAKAGLDWIIITDHNNMFGFQEEGWYDGVAVIVGEEISPHHGDHYLAFDITQSISCDSSPSEFIGEVNKQGGFGFIAHPDENQNRKNGYRPLRWSDWDIDGFNGLEIWNYTADWVDQYDPARALYYFLFRDRVIKGPTQNVLSWWDNLNSQNEHVVPAIGSLDAHALKRSFVKIFPYQDMFKTITNFVYHDEKLSSDFDEAKKQVHNSLKNGNNLIINRIWSAKSDEIIYYISNKQEKAFSGSIIALNPENKMSVKLPKTGNIKIIHDGKVVRDITACEFQMGDLKPGKYRMEVYYKNRPWIFSNPIIVKSLSD